MPYRYPWSHRRFTRRRQSSFCDGEATHTWLGSYQTSFPIMSLKAFVVDKNKKRKTNSLRSFLLVCFWQRQTKDKKVIHNLINSKSSFQALMTNLQGRERRSLKETEGPCSSNWILHCIELSLVTVKQITDVNVPPMRAQKFGKLETTVVWSLLGFARLIDQRVWKFEECTEER